MTDTKTERKCRRDNGFRCTQPIYMRVGARTHACAEEPVRMRAHARTRTHVRMEGPARARVHTRRALGGEKRERRVVLRWALRLTNSRREYACARARATENKERLDPRARARERETASALVSIDSRASYVRSARYDEGLCPTGRRLAHAHS